MMQRNPTLDALRGLAALLVLTSHAGGALSPRFLDLMLSRFDLGQVGVVIFFLISGWIIPQSIQHGRRVFWARRFFRLYPLYWIVLILTGGPLGVLLVNATMLAPHPLIPVAWTLTVELVFYALVSIAPPVPLIVPLLIAQSVLDYWLPLSWPLPGHLAILCCGAAVRERRYLPVACTLLIVCCSPRVLVFEPAHVWARLAGVAVFLFVMRQSYAPRVLVWLGERSYSLYLTHPLVLAWLPPLLWLPGVLLFSAMTYAWIERPAIALGLRLFPREQRHASRVRRVT